MVERPNIIFYVSDSLRAANLSCYGYDRDTAPHIDRLASDGIRFERAFSQAFKTVESSVSILTGLYPPTHKAYTTRHSVPEDAPSIAKRLQENGYATGGFSSLVQISRRRGFEQGFDTWKELFQEEWGDKSDSYPDWAKLCTDHTIKWIKTVEKPFFAFIWSNGTHNPYAPHAGRFTDEETDNSIDGSLQSLRQAKRADAPRVRDLYDDTIRHADRHFGRLLNYLKQAGIYEKTMIVLTSDHGEVLSEHGRMENAYELPKKITRRLFPGVVQSQTLFESGGHVGHLSILPYDELLHVPTILKFPDGRYAGKTCGQMIETIDLMPTVASVTGIPFKTQGMPLDNEVIDSGNGKNYVYSDTAISRGVVNFRSLRSEEYKLVRTNWAPSRLADIQELQMKNVLYSLLRKSICDSELLFKLPGEISNVARDQPEIMDSFRTDMDRWFERCKSKMSQSQTTNIDERTEEQLRDLGYLE